MLRQFIPNISISRIIGLFRLAKRAFGGYRWHIVLLAVLGVLAGLLEGIGVNALIPLFSQFSGQGVTPEFDTISQLIARFFGMIGIEMALPSLLLFVVLLFVLKSLVLLLFEYINITIKKRYERDERRGVYEKTLDANWSYLMTQKSGYLSTVIRTDVARSADLLSNISSIIMVMTGTFIYLVVAFNISQTVTVMALVAGMLIFLIFKPLFFYARKVAKQTSELNKEMDRHVNESVTSVKTIKAFGRESGVSRLGVSMFDALKDLSIRSALYRKFATTFIEPASIIFIAAVVAFSYYQTSYSLGALAAIVYLIHRIFVYVKQLQDNAHAINESIPYLEQLLMFQDDAKKFTETTIDSGDEPFTFNKRIECKDVSFAYGDREVLKDLSLTISRGAFVGFMGVSGGGKTTLFDLLLRLLRPMRGKITIDGKNCSAVSLSEWRENVGYVPQDTSLINDTVANNIRFYDASISEEDVVDAAKKAYMIDFVEQLSDGFDTVLGADGVALSVGQRQRLAIARALVRKPAILLLDEATSSLDRESEIMIEKTLSELQGEITICVIAHRIRTVERADMLYVIDKGRVVESGSPDELLQKKDSYFSRIRRSSMSMS